MMDVHEASQKMGSCQAGTSVRISTPCGHGRIAGATCIHSFAGDAVAVKVGNEIAAVVMHNGSVILVERHVVTEEC